MKEQGVKMEHRVPVTLEQNEKGNTIRLEGAVGIDSAGELKALLLKALEPGREVRIALEGAADLDVTAIELLWAARREAKVSGVKFAFAEGAPEAVTAALAEAGFEKFEGGVRAG